MDTTQKLLTFSNTCQCVNKVVHNSIYELHYCDCGQFKVYTDNGFSAEYTKTKVVMKNRFTNRETVLFPAQVQLLITKFNPRTLQGKFTQEEIRFLEYLQEDHL